MLRIAKLRDSSVRDSFSKMSFHPMATPIHATLRLDDLVIGSTSQVGFTDVTGRLVIPVATVITQSLVDEIRLDGVTLLQIVTSGESPGEAPESIPTPLEIADTASQKLLPYSAERVARLQEKFYACESLVDQLVDSLQQGIPINVREAEQEISDYANELASDPDPVIAGALVFQSDLTLARRCVQFSVLSMAIALSQKLQPSDVHDIGIGALMHDWSLFLLPKNARFPHLPMDAAMRLEYSKHPLTSESLLKNFRGSTETQRTIVAQVHELLDGSGFPRGISGRQFHPLAKIASVADSYLTLTSPPPGVTRVIPCDAMAYLIAGASKGRFAPAAVTAMLEAVTLYPLGSTLELSDTTLVRVIRGNAGDYGYPIVQAIANPERVIDLRNSHLFITRPVASSDYDEARLPDAYKELNSGSP